ncbi:MAG: hypothetical protein JO352_00695 [Chloroflexi bacterium]|nr:hypothetical protein [Chloroflexota bacterium]
MTGISGLAQLTGAAWHSLVLKNDGTVWAWGGNWFGELGNGTTTNSTTPVQATGLTGQTLIAAGREHSMSATASRLATTTYAYDKLYRLTGAAGPSGSTVYSYDPNGNRLSKVLGGNSTSYSYDKADRILTAGSTSYTVNAAGNVTARGSDAFGYDQANRLTSATTSTGSSSYAYDGDGKRVSKVVAGVTTNYVYDVGGGLPVLLDDGTQKYVWGANGLAESVNKTSSAVAVYHTDGLGSVRALSDSTGSVTQTYQTDEFGVPTTIQGGSTQPFGFTGEQTDPASGFSYLRARMYDPSSGRFMQHDTSVGSLTSAQSLNRYTYVVNRPTSLYDPTGHTATQSNVLSNISATTPMFTDAATGASSNQQDVLCLPMLDPFGFGGAPVCFPNPFGSGQAQVPARSGSITAQLQQARAGKELATYSITLEADPLIGYVTVDEGISAFSALYATYLPARARRSLPAAMALARVASNISKYPPNGVSQIGHIFIVPFQYGGDTWHFDLVNNYGVNFKS